MRKRKRKTERRRFRRRRAQRLQSSLHIRYKKKGNKSNWKWVAYKDISGIGIGLLTNEPLKVNNRVNVSIHMKNNPEPVQVECRVVWCSALDKGMYKVGLEFSKVKDSIRFIEFLCDKMLDLSLSPK